MRTHVLTQMHVHTHVCTHNTAVPPTITTDPRPLVSAREWNEVILTCSASATPTPTIRWEREGGAVLPVGAVPTYSTSGNMVSTYHDRRRHVDRCSFT